ncbi:hypothetical protein [Paraclostridium sordellii]|uniref:Uncharacterized protein n=1 Tax=Paraclostridium sordellii TaxID=1505 RepID=A0A9P1KZ99_PARSO|nr:hypothetical protein [Paeniclostridium sordellii]CEN25364.1 Uncharacterised protein [[Clostridium] sordellii] [Paeniclostridium sordellii]CEN27149.1 Uncharacterised protein [[Clostridium] sordellii] [Paeniclostridium sordellii]CEN31819.1 Uncharacterised protein [[Clostridium] sordellii] [Paeniclostridium sordellii]CEP40759.1 Uncharacterised protein [[Clostridium] sordellii] [Paeniclostridium sordellii]CEP45161.1 Uncharacterised protein [[Clostridium] sordellii] [Paeniclostridium sordellii]
MLDIKNFTKVTLEKLKKFNTGDQLELLTYKKDRKIIIMKTDYSKFHIIEDGFEYNEFKNIDIKNLEKILKKLKKIEFPRSNKFFLKIINKKDSNEQISFKLI